MNVWGKRSASVAFPNDGVFSTLVVKDSLTASNFLPYNGNAFVFTGDPGMQIVGAGGLEVVGGPIEGDDIKCQSVDCAVSIRTPSIGNNLGSLQMTAFSILQLSAGNYVQIEAPNGRILLPTNSGVGGVDITGYKTIGPHDIGLDVSRYVNAQIGVLTPIVESTTTLDVTSTGVMTVSSNNSRISLITDSGVGCVDVDGYKVVGSNNIGLDVVECVRANAGVVTPVVKSQTGGPVTIIGNTGIVLDPGVTGLVVAKGMPVVTKQYQSLLGLDYNPNIALVTALPDGTVPVPFTWLSTDAHVGRGLDITVQGYATTNPAGGNTIEWQIRGGPAGTDVLFAFVTHPMSPTAAFQVNYRCHLVWNITSLGSPGSCQTSVHYTEDTSGTGDTRSSFAVYSSPMDTTVTNEIDVFYRVGDNTQRIATEFAYAYRV